MMRSTYTYSFEDGVHLIVDHDKGMSVTNDAENVIRDLFRANADLRLPVIYRDSSGAFDRLLVRDDKFAGFGLLRTRNLATAIQLTRGFDDE